jgi:hypothetical protein
LPARISSGARRRHACLLALRRRIGELDLELAQCLLRPIEQIEYLAQTGVRVEGRGLLLHRLAEGSLRGGEAGELRRAWRQVGRARRMGEAEVVVEEPRIGESPQTLLAGLDALCRALVLQQDAGHLDVVFERDRVAAGLQLVEHLPHGGLAAIPFLRLLRVELFELGELRQPAAGAVHCLRHLDRRRLGGNAGRDRGDEDRAERVGERAGGHRVR